MRYEYFARKLAEDYIGRGIPSGASYPDMDLYIDQMVSCLNKELDFYSEAGEGPVTKAMVGNYTKHKMIPGPEGKRYSRDHLYLMTIVFLLKNAFSMDQIQQFMAPVLASYASEWDEKTDIGDIFGRFSEFIKDREKDFPAEIAKLVAEVKKGCARSGSEDDMIELMVTILVLVMESNAKRYMAEKLLEEYFSK